MWSYRREKREGILDFLTLLTACPVLNPLLFYLCYILVTSSSCKNNMYILQLNQIKYENNMHILYWWGYLSVPGRYNPVVLLSFLYPLLLVNLHSYLPFNKDKLSDCTLELTQQSWVPMAAESKPASWSFHLHLLFCSTFLSSWIRKIMLVTPKETL